MVIQVPEERQHLRGRSHQVIPTPKKNLTFMICICTPGLVGGTPTKRGKPEKILDNEWGADCMRSQTIPRKLCPGTRRNTERKLHHPVNAASSADASMAAGHNSQGGCQGK